MKTMIKPWQTRALLEKPTIARLLRHGLVEGQSEYTFEEVRERLEKGVFQLWCFHGNNELDALMLTTIEVWPSQKSLHVELVVGKNADAYWHHLEDLKAFAKQLDAKRITASVRPGLEKKLKAMGFSSKRIRMHKEL